MSMTQKERDLEDAREIERLKSIPYTDKRRLEYPNIGDQLDAIWKIFNQLRLDGVKLPQEGDDMLGTILAVKKKYPKGE